MDFFVYIIILLVFIYIAYIYRQQKIHNKSVLKLNEAKENNMLEPPSLHPVINPINCIGCGACIPSCPEHALGLISGKAVLVAPTKCIGHGACAVACPVKGIELVFGTEKRGMDIPKVSPEFETNIPGIFIAGELGGMGLIRKTTEQGRQAMEYIAKKKNGKNKYDVVIIGCGPAGFSATLAAHEKGLKYHTMEQEDDLGGAVYHYPRNKLTMTAPVNLPIVGEIKIFDIKKEDLLKIWKDVAKKTGITINFNERMEKIIKTDTGFVVETPKGKYETTTVLLSIGRRGTPRKLEVPGEEQAKVVYRLIDADQYKGMHVLVVGGGDSAVEAAVSLSDVEGVTATLSYRSEAFGRIKAKNKSNLEEAEKSGRLRVMLKSTVKEITKDEVIIKWNDAEHTLKNEAIIVSAGGILPTPFLKEIGILVNTHIGQTSFYKKDK